MNLIIKHTSQLLFIFSFSLLGSCINSHTSPILDDTSQMVLITTETDSATSGWMTRFERSNQDWIQNGESIPINVGRTGLAAGIGLHPSTDLDFMPIKREGDGKSPAGIFTLTATFSFDDSEISPLPHIKITESIECVDDTKSAYYNQIIDRDTVKNIDWISSERMLETVPYYFRGITVNHNPDRIPAAGSCIFLHYWKEDNETTSGCSSMTPKDMDALAEWLNPKKKPVLVQLTQLGYDRLKEKWQLP